MAGFRPETAFRCVGAAPVRAEPRCARPGGTARTCARRPPLCRHLATPVQIRQDLEQVGAWASARPCALRGPRDVDPEPWRCQRTFRKRPRDERRSERGPMCIQLRMRRLPVAAIAPQFISIESKATSLPLAVARRNADQRDDNPPSRPHVPCHCGGLWRGIGERWLRRPDAMDGGSCARYPVVHRTGSCAYSHGRAAPGVLCSWARSPIANRPRRLCTNTGQTQTHMRVTYRENPQIYPGVSNGFDRLKT